jgi:catechol 2,3-dioxygenase-like lactoylglutathione lyase family enzyme
MLQHVTLEVAAEEIERSVEFWALLGFARVEPPAALAETFTWVERKGTQIHLERNASPVVPAHGHTAVVVADFEQTLARLREAGFEVAPGREHWGSPRAKATAPGGHKVEFMASPPAPKNTENRSA